MIGKNWDEVFEPIVDLAEDARDFGDPIWNHVSEEAKSAGEKIIAVVDDIANRIEGGIEALLNDLNSLPQETVNTIKEYFIAVTTLKNTHSRIVELYNQLKSSDLPLKDLMNSEENKRCALEMADKTLKYFQVLNKIIKLLNDLCNLLGDDLRNRLRQCDPLISKWLTL
ncbi:Uncharacterised protein [uncultured archaeon]|nr:Uncharacterised protein [uncultured archaeon]